MHISNSIVDTLVLIPHFDDEFFVLPAFFLPGQKFGTVKFVFMTESQGPRLKESERFLASFGFSPEQYIALGNELNIPDGQVVEHIKLIVAKLSAIATSASCIICPAWEGGHQDHDACFLIGRELAGNGGKKLLEYATYNGEFTTGRFFRLMTPLQSSDINIRIKIPLQIYLSMMTRLRFFRSQWKTWLAFLPALLLKAVYGREIYLSSSVHMDPLRKPHDGLLLYERYNRMTYEQFVEILNREKTTD